MKKCFYDHKPSVVEIYDGASDIVNLNIEEVEKTFDEETVKEWSADTIVVTHPATYSEVVDALVREAYTVSDELAILRQRDNKPDEFNAYYAFVEECKEKASVLKVTD